MISEIVGHNTSYSITTSKIYHKIFKLPRVIIFINGCMGAGKTTFSNSLLKHYNCLNLTSGSFSLVNYFNTDRKIVHCDFYRYQPDDSFYETEIFPFLDNNFLLLIEWGDPNQLMIDANHFSVDITVFPDKCRQLNFVPIDF